MKVCAIIPIKHQSSRITGKNFKLFDNRPLYHHILNTLSKSKHINRIIVNTDSNLLKESLVDKYPTIEIYDRPSYLLGDDISVNFLLLDTINSLQLDADIYLQTHVTNPLLKIQTIDKAIEQFADNINTNDSLFSVKTLYTRLYDKDGKDMNHNRFTLIPTQNLDPIYEENSCIYLFTKDTITTYNARIGKNPILFKMSDIESQDIDWPCDFVLAETLFKMQKKKILITCPPMINRIDKYNYLFEKYDLEYVIPELVQTLPEDELIDILPQYDGWIIGDDIANETVLTAGKNGKLKACVKWGVGTDNIDFDVCEKLGIPVSNTPNMFGNEVADIAIGYLIGLARDTFYINDKVKDGFWPKPCGMSLSNKKVAVIGFGDIGKNICKRLQGFDINVFVSDPAFTQEDSMYGVTITDLNTALTRADFIIVACSLNKHTFHLLNYENIKLSNKNVRIINVSRGSVIKESDIVKLLDSGHIYGVAFDVFEEEPVSLSNPLFNYNTNIFGTHNSSNTSEAVDRTSIKAINTIYQYLTSSLG